MTENENRPAGALPPDVTEAVELAAAAVGGDEDAWKRLVTRHLGFIHAVARHFARGDEELEAELVVAALEGLRAPGSDGRPAARLRAYVESVPRYGTASRFTTWLAMVLRNIFRDWMRSRQGRRRLPAALQGLPELEREVFAGLAWQGLGENELFHRLQARFPGLDWERFEQAIGNVGKHLGRERLDRIWLQVLARRPMLASWETLSDDRATPADPSPWSRPDLVLEFRQAGRRLGRLGRALGRALDALPEQQRQVVLLRTLHELSGEQIRRALGLERRQQVYDLLARARRRLRRSLQRAGFGPADLRELPAGLEGFVDWPRGEWKKIEKMQRRGTDPGRGSVALEQMPEKGRKS